MAAPRIRCTTCQHQSSRRRSGFQMSDCNFAASPSTLKATGDVWRQPHHFIIDTQIRATVERLRTVLVSDGLLIDTSENVLDRRLLRHFNRRAFDGTQCVTVRRSRRRPCLIRLNYQT